jgi:hypothetical protein
MPPAVLVLHLRAARRKARAAAVAEALALLHDLGPSALAGGPLSERGGVAWVELPGRDLAAATARLPRLGYTTAVDLVTPAASSPDVTWRGRPWRLERLHTEDAAAMREQAPDRREFLFAPGGGPVRPVRGYRGGGDPLGRRGLPVCDARLLVNLVAPAGPGLLLDPFAGVGGVALAARAAGWATVTADLDPALRHGLGRLGGGAHLVADARRPPLRAGCVDAVATEPPYDREVGTLAEQALAGAGRLLRPGGATAWLCAAWQAPGLRATAARLGLRPVLDCPVDRKGLEVVALAWRRPPP